LTMLAGAEANKVLTTNASGVATWQEAAGGWDGILPNYTTAQRNDLSLTDGLIVYNTTENAVQIYRSDSWANVGAKLSLAATCSLDGDCDSTHCEDGICCATTCDGNCDHCNVAGLIGTCTNVGSDCTGNCDVCSSGNCVAVAATCTGNCDQCTGAGTEYNCAASNSLCSNSASSCYCSGSGTSFNCQSCADDPYGACGHPICDGYTCGQAYDNGVYCAYNGYDNGATNYYCSTGTCYCTSSSSTTSPDEKDNNCNGIKDERSTLLECHAIPSGIKFTQACTYLGMLCGSDGSPGWAKGYSTNCGGLVYMNSCGNPNVSQPDGYYVKCGVYAYF